MTEADEVAAAMLPKYLQECSLHSMAGVREWVMKELSAYESYNVIDAVQAALIALVMPNRTRSDGKLAHVWITGEQAGFAENSMLYKMQMCRDCGVLKGPDKYPESPCKGKVRVTTR